MQVTCSIMRNLFLSILLLSLLACHRSGLAPGENAPSFSLKDLSGNTVSLESFKGKVVLLNFWATWCAPCVVEMPSLAHLHDKLKDRGFSVVSIAMQDNPESVKEFVDKSKFPFPVLLDESGEVGSLYKTTGLPESFLLSKEGKILMFTDPRTDEPIAKIRGEREWDSPEAIASILRAMESK